MPKWGHLQTEEGNVDEFVAFIEGHLAYGAYVNIKVTSSNLFKVILLAIFVTSVFALFFSLGLLTPHNAGIPPSFLL